MTSTVGAMAKLHYGPSTINLNPATDIDELKATVAEILRGGSSDPWVTVTAANDRPYDLLVAPGIPIYISERLTEGRPRRGILSD